MRLAIVIVSYHGRRFLRRGLDSCARHAPGVPVYVVDNASSDGSAALVAREFPHAVLLPQPANLGFAGGNNVGIGVALGDGAEAIFLLNQDAELTPGCLEALARYLEQHPGVAAVQPAIFLPDGLVNSLGNSFHYLGFAESGGNGMSLGEARSQLPWLRSPGEPPYLSGAAVLLRAAALRQVGVFEEELFMYHEDLELCLRLRLAGWRLGLEPRARAVHHYDHQRSLRQFSYMERNRYLVWLSYWKLPTLLLLAVPALLAELVVLVAAVLRGWFVPKLASYRYFVRIDAWRTLGERRRRLRQLRQVNDRELLGHATAVIRSRGATRGSAAGLTHVVANTLSAAWWAVLFPLIRW